MSCGIATLGSAALIHYLLLILLIMSECLVLSFKKCGMLFLDRLISVLYACHDAGQDNCLETYTAHLRQIAESSFSDCSAALAQGRDLYYLWGGVHAFPSSNYCFAVGLGGYVHLGLLVCLFWWVHKHI